MQVNIWGGEISKYVRNALLIYLKERKNINLLHECDVETWILGGENEAEWIQQLLPFQISHTLHIYLLWDVVDVVEECSEYNL